MQCDKSSPVITGIEPYNAGNKSIYRQIVPYRQQQLLCKRNAVLLCLERYKYLIACGKYRHMCDLFPKDELFPETHSLRDGRYYLCDLYMQSFLLYLKSALHMSVADNILSICYLFQKQDRYHYQRYR